jgi:hypothetical protein
MWDEKTNPAKTCIMTKNLGLNKSTRDPFIG